jgi:hypothetical protein
MAKPHVGKSIRLVLALALVTAWSTSRAADEPASVAEEAAPQATAAGTNSATAASPASAASMRTAPHGQHAAHRTPEQALDDRISGLGKALGLDAGQKAEVRKILMVQQSQLRQVWSDPARSSADRIGASQSINKQTEDRIRSVLNETQRQQYIASKPAGAAAGHPEHGLDYWMDQMQGKQ